MRPFVEDYLAGRTPIPCTLCNNDVKFEQLLTTARQIGAERIATGHYARVRRNRGHGRYELLRAVDESKDQTYFLFGLTQEQLARTDFPLGELTKQEVRDIARRLAVPVAEKPESQEICFVPTGSYVRFIESYLQEQGSALSSEAGRHRPHCRRSARPPRRAASLHGGTAARTGLRGRAARLRGRAGSRAKSLGRRRRCGIAQRHVRSARRELDCLRRSPMGPVQAAVRIRNRHEPAAAEITPL